MNLEELLLNSFRKKSGADENVLSDRTILETIELHGLPEEDKVDEFVEKLTPTFKTIAGQSRAILAAAKKEKEDSLKVIEEEYKKKLEELEKEVDPNDGDSNPNENGMKKDKVIETLSSELEEIRNTLSKLTEGKVIESKKNALNDHAKELGLSDSYVLRQALNQIDFSKDDIEEIKKDLETTYIAEYKECRQTDAPGIGGQGSGDVVDSYLDRKFKEKADKGNEYEPKF